jgi:hypothetical protein
VDVVIGDYLYSFQFKLEDGGEDDEPQPLDMDSFWDEQHDEHMEEGQGKPATLFHLMGNKTEMQLEFLVQIALFLIPAEGRNKSSKLLYLTSHHNRNRLEKEKSVIKLPVLLISGRAHLIR